MNLVLCGMPGAGKTSAGKVLSEITGKKFLDTDEAIAADLGGIPEIFRDRGEAFFREREKELCRRLAEEDGLIVATGGGAVLHDGNAALLKENGKLFYLRAKIQTLLSRLKNGSGRPLLQGDLEERLSSLFAERSAAYEQVADLIIDTDGLSIREVAEKIFEVQV